MSIIYRFPKSPAGKYRAAGDALQSKLYLPDGLIEDELELMISIYENRHVYVNDTAYESLKNERDIITAYDTKTGICVAVSVREMYKNKSCFLKFYTNQKYRRMGIATNMANMWDYQKYNVEVGLGEPQSQMFFDKLGIDVSLRWKTKIENGMYVERLYNKNGRVVGLATHGYSRDTGE